MTNRNSSFIPFAKPALSKEEEKAVISVIRSGWLTTGPETAKFEKEFAEYTGSSHALAVNSGTAGLHLGLESLNVKPNDLVITTPYTFTASAEIIRYLGANPVFIDINKKTNNIDPELLEKALKTKKIKAMVIVHIAGLPCNMKIICDLSKKYNVPFIEDAAHSFPVKTSGKFAGTFGESGIYSFYANKTMTTGEGGMIVTDNENIARRIKIMRLHGIDRDCWDRYNSKKPGWYYQVIEPGFKYNLPDILSAIGRIQLKKAKNFLIERMKIAKEYIKRLSEYDFLEIPDYSDEHAWHIFIIKIKNSKLNITRNDFIEELSKAGIGTSVHYIPLHIMPYYKNLYGYKPEDFPNAYNNYRSCISLPIYPGLRKKELDYIINSIKKIGGKYYKK